MRLARPDLRSLGLELWGISFAVAVFFAGLQAILMSDNWWFAVPTVALPVGIYLLMHFFVKRVSARRKWARALLLLLAAAHLIPVIRQIAGFVEPSIDSVILGLVALGLVSAA
jgi:hypothetical protein